MNMKPAAHNFGTIEEVHTQLNCCCRFQLLLHIFLYLFIYRTYMAYIYNDSRQFTTIHTIQSMLKTSSQFNPPPILVHC